MRELHCPVCGNSFVRMICQESRAERLLSHLNIFPFRCKLCTNRFRAFYSGGRYNTQAFDRREFTRLTTSIEAQILDYKQPIVTQVAKLKEFYRAEAYHQNYAELHPDQPYIAINDAPKVEHLKKAYPQLYTDKLASHE